MKSFIMSTPEPENTNYEVGYKKVPKHAHFKPGQSGNPRGPAKKPVPASLSEAIAHELHKLHTLKGPGRRQRRSAKEVMVRQLVADAANEDLQAFGALIGLLEEHGPNSTLGIEWRSQSFRDALYGKSWDKLTDEFFEKQDQEKAAWRKELRESQPLGMLIKRELARKVDATRDGKPVKVSMRDLIVSRFIKKAIDGDHAVMKLLLKIVPEKTFMRRAKTHVERPTPIEQGWLDEERKKEEWRNAALQRELNYTPEKKAWVLARGPYPYSYPNY